MPSILPFCSDRCGAAVRASVLTLVAFGLIGPLATSSASAENNESVETAETADAPRKRSRKGRAKQGKKRRVIKIKRKRKSRGGAYIRYGLGFGGCLDESKLTCPGSTQTSDAGGVDTTSGPGFFDLELGYRPQPGLMAFELQISQNQYDIIASENREVGANFIFGGLGLKLFPVSKGKFDPYVGVRVGGMSVTQDNATDALDEGFMFSVLGGADYLFNRHIGVGASWGSHWLQGQEDTHTFWTARLSVIVYFDLTGSSRKKKRKIKTVRPKKKRDRY